MSDEYGVSIFCAYAVSYAAVAFWVQMYEKREASVWLPSCIAKGAKSMQLFTTSSRQFVLMVLSKGSVVRDTDSSYKY